MANVPVLPVPDCACAMTSLHLMTGTMARCEKERHGTRQGAVVAAAVLSWQRKGSGAAAAAAAAARAHLLDGRRLLKTVAVDAAQQLLLRGGARKERGGGARAGRPASDLLCPPGTRKSAARDGTPARRRRHVHTRARARTARARPAMAHLEPHLVKGLEDLGGRGLDDQAVLADGDRRLGRRRRRRRVAGASRRRCNGGEAAARRKWRRGWAGRTAARRRAAARAGRAVQAPRRAVGGRGKGETTRTQTHRKWLPRGQ